MSNFEIFSGATKQLNQSLTSMKTAKSSPAKGHGAGGGGRPGVPRVWTQDPCHGLGSPFRKKNPQDPGLNPHTAAVIHKEF